MIIKKDIPKYYEVDATVKSMMCGNNFIYVLKGWDEFEIYYLKIKMYRLYYYNFQRRF